jgi:hypothetical protein
MRKELRRAALVVSMLVASSAMLEGCAALGKKEPPPPTATLEAVLDDYDYAQLQAQATQDAVTELSVAPNADLRQAYDEFAETADRMLEAGRRLIAHADAMHFRGPAYFVESEQSATACLYPRRQPPQDRRLAQLGVYFNAVADQGWQVKRAYRDYQFDVTELKYYLSCRLTPDRRQLMAKIFRKAAVDAESLQEALDRALDTLDRAKLAKAAPPAAS